MRGAHRLLAGLLAAGALLTATGCAQSVDPIERLVRKAAQKAGRPPRPPGAGPAGARGRHGDHGTPGAGVVARGQPPAGRHSPAPSPHGVQDRPGSYEEKGAGSGCDRR